MIVIIGDRRDVKDTTKRLSYMYELAAHSNETVGKNDPRIHHSRKETGVRTGL